MCTEFRGQGTRKVTLEDPWKSEGLDTCPAHSQLPDHLHRRGHSEGPGKTHSHRGRLASRRSSVSLQSEGSA